LEKGLKGFAIEFKENEPEEDNGAEIEGGGDSEESGKGEEDAGKEGFGRCGFGVEEAESADGEAEGKKLGIGDVTFEKGDGGENCKDNSGGELREGAFGKDFFGETPKEGGGDEHPSGKESAEPKDVAGNCGEEVEEGGLVVVDVFVEG